MPKLKSLNRTDPLSLKSICLIGLIFRLSLISSIIGLATFSALQNLSPITCESHLVPHRLAYEVILFPNLLLIIENFSMKRGYAGEFIKSNEFLLIGICISIRHLGQIAFRPPIRSLVLEKSMHPWWSSLFKELRHCGHETWALRKQLPSTLKSFPTVRRSRTEQKRSFLILPFGSTHWINTIDALTKSF